MEIDESSLSQILTHVKEDQNFAILTAYRGSYSANENIRRNKALAADIRNLGYGFIHLEGHFIENKGTPEERDVDEDSLFVISNGDTNFNNNIKKLAKKYEQESIVLKDKDKIYIFDFESGAFDIGDYHPGKIGEYYSKLKTSYGGTFVFEGVVEEKGLLTKYLDSLKEKNKI